MMDGSIASWVQVMTQVQATTDAYRAMGVTGGILQSDLNALTLAASDQVTAMTKVNQAWDTVIGITSGGQAALHHLPAGHPVRQPGVRADRRHRPDRDATRSLRRRLRRRRPGPA